MSNAFNGSIVLCGVCQGEFINQRALSMHLSKNHYCYEISQSFHKQLSYCQPIHRNIDNKIVYQDNQRKTNSRNVSSLSDIYEDVQRDSASDDISVSTAVIHLVPLIQTCLILHQTLFMKLNCSKY